MNDKSDELQTSKAWKIQWDDDDVTKDVVCVLAKIIFKFSFFNFFIA